ncbi:MAG: hypothetical protein ACKO6J_04775 [Crocinitomicaceae bacterium]
MPSLIEIVNYIGINYSFEDKEINSICSSTDSVDNSLTWTKSLANLSLVKSGVVICYKEDYHLVNKIKSVSYLPVDNPRLTFAYVAHKFFSHLLPDDFSNKVDTYRNRRDLKIGDNVFIGSEVEIGEGSIIHHNVVIYSKSKIGKQCIINTNVSIGTEGLGLEFDSSKKCYVKFPQIGSVIIGDQVEIGPNSTIRRSAIGETIIGNGTKIGSLCNIGHNCILGENNLLTSNVILAGSSHVGSDVYFGISSSIRNRVNIGNSVVIGQGAVVVKDIPEGETWVGNPAKKIKR